MISYTGGLFTSTTFEGRFIETGGGGGMQFSKDDGISFPERTSQIQRGKAQVREVGGHAAEDQ